MFGHYYPTDRLRERINKVSISIMENGLHEWYVAYYKYVYDMVLSRQHNISNNANFDDLHSLTMDQMIRPFYFCIGFVILTIFVFIGELIIFKWKTRRDRKH